MGKDSGLGEKIGEIRRETSTKEFSFEVAPSKSISRYQYVVVKDRDDKRNLLGQVESIERSEDREIATCRTLRNVVGNTLKSVNRPAAVGSQVYFPTADFLTDMFSHISTENRLRIGKLLSNQAFPIYFNYQDLDTHLFTVASTGGGKSYTLAVLMEELLELEREEKPALLIFDFHNEFGGLALPNQDENQVAALEEFGLAPKDFQDDLRVFNWEWNPIKLDPHFSSERLKFLSNMPEEYSLFLKNVIEDSTEKLTLQELEKKVKESDLHSARKQAMESRIKGLKNSGLFSNTYFRSRDLVESGKATLVQLGSKKIEDWAVRFVVADVLRDLYQAKLNDELSTDVVLFLDEAHKFSPKSSGDPLSRIIHTITREGRKLGLFLVLSTQTSQDLSEDVMRNCNSLLTLRSSKRQMRILARIYGLEKEITEVLSEMSPGEGFFQAPSLPFSFLIDVRPRKTSEVPKRNNAVHKRINRKIKNVALETKEYLLYTQPKRKIRKWAKQWERFSIQKIQKKLSLSTEDLIELISDLDDVILPFSSETDCYYVPYWHTIKNKASEFLHEEGRLDSSLLPQKFDISLRESEKVLALLGAKHIYDTFWYLNKKLEKTKKRIQTLLANKGKMPLNQLAKQLDLPKNEIDNILKSLSNIEKLPSNLLYDSTFIEDTKNEVIKRLDHQKYCSPSKLAEQVAIPLQDLQKITRDLPITHLKLEKYWYLDSTVKQLKEKLRSLEKKDKTLTFKELKHLIAIPKPDLQYLLQELELSSLVTENKEESPSTLAQMLYNDFQKFPVAEKLIIKLLLRNNRTMSTSNLYSRVDKRAIYSLEAKNIIKRKKKGNVLVLGWNEYLKKKLPNNVDEKTLKKIETRLVRKFR